MQAQEWCIFEKQVWTWTRERNEYNPRDYLIRWKSRFDASKGIIFIKYLVKGKSKKSLLNTHHFTNILNSFLDNSF